ncbi:NAD(P)/FAD-dependent oxidoreductase [Plantibacter sp. VKM Ac-2880]|uniref:FAD-dependent oxidoreductase n=1 Tax=Plantibacter sp. VKM Ac-2880 TaxID=2783827 RepID=UPI00188DE7D5|nr:FAD-dependent oxidoreductase [Plantibacter sp. VKM Ac-2880]MBF4568874.1 NAD(P)/FAD-dependent oxidoreductase [Plantibacter sp. VKM Ac-2880]
MNAQRSDPLRIVLIGFGPVGARFAEELAPGVRAGDVALTVIGQEPVDAYNRVLVAEHATGSAQLADMTLVSARDLADDGIGVLLGATATRIDRAGRTVELDRGDALPYDHLVLATGARANVPTLDGVDRWRRDLPALEKYGARLMGSDHALPAGVCAMRDLDDADTVAAVVRTGGRIVVLGAGVLGLETALAAAKAGADVVVVHHGPTPMPRNLDRGAGSVLSGALRAAGVEVVANSRAEAVGYRDDPTGGRRFDALITADGKRIAGDLLLLSCGVSARSDLAVLAGLRVGAGVLVDEALTSWSDERISAIGDCAHVLTPTPERRNERVMPGGPSGLIGPGWRQAEWLAAHLLRAGAAADDRRGLLTPPPVERSSPVALKATGVDVVAVGDVQVDPWDVSPETADPCGLHGSARRSVSVWADPDHGRYVKMVTRAGVLSAFVAVGMPRAAAELTLLYESGGELPADRSVLLRLDGPDAVGATSADAFAPTTTVCTCNGVTVGRIQEAAEAGNITVSCIGKATRAGTGCGGCTDRITTVLERVAAVKHQGEPIAV